MENSRRYEFCEETVRIALASGLTRSQVANDLGVEISKLNEWIIANQDIEFVSKENLSLAKENDRLRRENYFLKEERDILKRAAAIFAKQMKE